MTEYRFDQASARVTSVVTGFLALTLFAASGPSLKAAQSVTLGWDRSTDAVAGYRVHYGGASKAYSMRRDVGRETGAVISGLKEGATYYFAVTAYSSAGLESDFSNELRYTVPVSPDSATSTGSATPAESTGDSSSSSPPSPASSVGSQSPAPWQSATIGSGLATGSASASSGTHTIKGAGWLGGSKDRFFFVYQRLTGDGQITARLRSLQNTSSSARVGVMIRENLTSGSRNVFMGITPTGTYRRLYRDSTNASTYSKSFGTAVLPDAWVRLVRAGNRITAYRSDDGVSWTPVETRTISMASNIHIGLAVSSADASNLTTVTMDNVFVVP
jgi:hypothetical protein